MRKSYYAGPAILRDGQETCRVCGCAVPDEHNSDVVFNDATLTACPCCCSALAVSVVDPRDRTAGMDANAHVPAVIATHQVRACDTVGEAAALRAMLRSEGIDARVKMCSVHWYRTERRWRAAVARCLSVSK